MPAPLFFTPSPYDDALPACTATLLMFLTLRGAPARTRIPAADVGHAIARNLRFQNTNWAGRVHMPIHHKFDFPIPIQVLTTPKGTVLVYPDGGALGLRPFGDLYHLPDGIFLTTPGQHWTQEDAEHAMAVLWRPIAAPPRVLRDWDATPTGMNAVFPVDVAPYQVRGEPLTLLQRVMEPYWDSDPTLRSYAFYHTATHRQEAQRLTAHQGASAFERNVPMFARVARHLFKGRIGRHQGWRMDDLAGPMIIEQHSFAQVNNPRTHMSAHARLESLRQLRHDRPDVAAIVEAHAVP